MPSANRTDTPAFAYSRSLPSIFFKEVFMSPISPLEFLAAFALSFLAGALLAACHCKYVGKIRREVHAHA
jgi:hypothetical protein